MADARAARDRRVRRTLAAIRSAFVSLMGERDFDEITISDIADRADVNRGTVYLHYTDKYDLLDHLIAEKLGELDSAIGLVSPLPSNSPEDIEPFLSIYGHFEKNQRFYSTMLNNRGTGIFRNRFHDVIARHIDAHITTRGEKGIHHALLSRFITGGIVDMAEWWITAEMPLSVEVMARDTARLYQNNQAEA